MCWCEKNKKKMITCQLCNIFPAFNLLIIVSILAFIRNILESWYTSSVSKVRCNLCMNSFLRPTMLSLTLTFLGAGSSHHIIISESLDLYQVRTELWGACEYTATASHHIITESLFIKTWTELRVACEYTTASHMAIRLTQNPAVDEDSQQLY